MIKAALLLTALVLVQVQSEVSDGNLWESHEDCIDADTHKLLPHEWDCTKFYYCEHGLKRVDAFSCAPGTEFSESLQVCTHAILANCELSNVAPSEEDDESVLSANPSTTSESTNESDDSCEYLDNGCPADFREKLLPHEDCGKYYQCVVGQLVERQCAIGTVFNAKVENCDWPNKVAGCENYVHVTSEEDEDDDLINDDAGSDNDNSNGDNDSDNGNNFDFEKLENGCPVDIHIHHLLSHETDCDKFYYCNFGEKVERSCPNGTHFHYEIQVCDWPANVNCELPGSGDNDNDSNDSENDTDSDTDNENDTEILENGCPADILVHKLLPHETECEKFYYCIYGEKVEKSCPEGTHFNYELQVCDWPWAAGCEILGGSCGGGNNDDDSGSGCNGNGDDNNDSGNGDGNNDNDNGDDNNDNDNGSGNNDNDSGDSNNDNDNDGNDNDCNNNNNENVCGDNGNGDDNDNGNGDDNDNGSEDNDNDNDNGNGDNNNDNDNGSGDNDDDNDNGNGDNNNDNDNGSGDNDNGSGDNDNGSGDNDNGNGDGDCGNGDGNSNPCESGCNVLPWAHNDCDKYWICNGQSPQIVTCSEGLHFNPSSLTCDFACNAGCDRKSTQITNGPDGLKVFIPWDKIDNSLSAMILKHVMEV